MATVNKLRYSNFADRIDIDAFEAALEFEPIESKDDEDRGYCILPYNSHTNGDTTGKFSINREKKIYNCWVCGGGSLLDLAMATQDLDPEAATQWIYQFANREETDDEFFDHLDELLSVPADRQPAVPYFNDRVLARYDAATEHPWLKERGISNWAIDTFNIRFKPEATRTNGEESYQGPTILFPHFWQGQLVGWQQRWLGEDRPKWVPKYTMTPDFPKNETLYGYDRAIDNHPGGYPVVCESVPSALFLWSMGIPAVVTFGSSVGESQMKLLRRFPGVILAPDNDEAGAKWTHTLESYLDRFIDVKILPVLDGTGSDIGDLAQLSDQCLVYDYLEVAYNSIDTLL